MADKRRSLAEVVATDRGRQPPGPRRQHPPPRTGRRRSRADRASRSAAWSSSRRPAPTTSICSAASGCASVVSAGFVGYETVFGLAPMYRRAVESGAVEAREHACYTIIAGLRAAAQGVPFMPLNGLQGSDLIGAARLRHGPRSLLGQDVVAVPAIVPDVALIHVQEADVEGNGRIWGSVFEDTLMVRAARRVILTAERIVDGATFAAEPDRTDVPGFLVEAVVEAPGGAWPTSCAGLYPYDEAVLAGLVEAAGRRRARFAATPRGILRVDPAGRLPCRGRTSRGAISRPATPGRLSAPAPGR